MAHVLESHGVHLLSLILVVLDLVGVSNELVLDTVCAPTTSSEGGSVGDAAAATAIGDLGQRLHDAEHALHRLSMIILSVLLTHLVLLVVALGPRKFFTHFFYTLDFVIVSVSLALESGLFVSAHDHAGGAAHMAVNDHGHALSHASGGHEDLVHSARQHGSQFLLLLTSWRVVRVVHGFLETVELSHHEVHELHEELDHTEDKLHHVSLERDKFKEASEDWRHVVAHTRAIERAVDVIQRRLARRRHGTGVSTGASASVGAGASAGTSRRDGGL